MGARHERIEKQLRLLIAEAIEDLADPRLGMVTLLRVELSRDKRFAKVYYSSLEEGAALRTTQRALEAARGHIQEYLAEQITLRHTPILEFIYDDRIAASFRIDAILKEISEELGTREDPAADYEVYDPEEEGEAAEADAS